MLPLTTGCISLHRIKITLKNINVKLWLSFQQQQNIPARASSEYTLQLADAKRLSKLTASDLPPCQAGYEYMLSVARFYTRLWITQVKPKFLIISVQAEKGATKS